MPHFFRVTDLPRLSVPSPLFEVHFIHTDNITVAFNQLKAGAEVPPHLHVHETIDYLEKGVLEMTVGNETKELRAGAVVRIGANIRHSARAITDCTVVNIFYPTRDDFRADESAPVAIGHSKK